MQSLCTLRDHCRQWPRNTRYQADATPYLGRTYMRRPLSRTFFGRVQKILRGEGDSAALMTRQTPTAGWSRWSSPVAARGAPKAQGLMNGSTQLIMRPCLLSHVHHLVFACGSESKAGAHCERTTSRRTNLYPVGSAPYQAPSCVAARAKGSKEDGTNLHTRRVSAKSGHGHASTLDRGIAPTRLRCCLLILVRP